MSTTRAKPQTFTALIPTQPLPPPDLSLLLSPVRANEPSAPDEYVGRADGVIVDGGWRVVAFIVRLARKLDERGARTLVPVTALSLMEGPMLSLLWTEDQLRAQPRLDEELEPHNEVDGGPPVKSQWMPARPNVVPPGPGVNLSAAAKDGIEGGLLGAAIGAVAGLAIGGPFVGAGLAVFFAGGGSLAGLMSGASQETAAESSEMKLAPLDKDDEGALGFALRRLENALHDPGLQDAGFITAIHFTPTTSTATTPAFPKEATSQP